MICGKHPAPAGFPCHGWDLSGMGGARSHDVGHRPAPEAESQTTS